MKINDLNHIEPIAQNIVGGISSPYPLGSSRARARADALTIGRNTFSSTYTLAYAVAGTLAASRSRSYASVQ